MCFVVCADCGGQCTSYLNLYVAVRGCWYPLRGGIFRDCLNLGPIYARGAIFELALTLMTYLVVIIVVFRGYFAEMC